MNPLDTNRRVFIWLCICPAEKDETKREKISHIAFSVTVYMCIICAIAGSAVFICNNLLIDFESSLFALFQLSGLSGVFLYEIDCVCAPTPNCKYFC